MLRCGYPCLHVLCVTNDLTIDMIKVQHWKLYASHYNDTSFGIGDELKKLQFQYSHYEGFGVPIHQRLLERARKQSDDDVFPYFYHREPNETTLDDYNNAIKIERRNCCVTNIEYAYEIGIEKNMTEASDNWSILISFITCLTLPCIFFLFC